MKDERLQKNSQACFALMLAEQSQANNVISAT
jgi:hypothetical protein